MKCFLDYISTTLTDDEITVFTDIVTNEFYGWKPVYTELKLFKPKLDEIVASEGYNKDKSLINNINLLVEMLNIRNGIAIIGPRSSGKSTVINLIKKTVNTMRDEEIESKIKELRNKFEDKSTTIEKPASKEELFEIRKQLILTGIDSY